MKRYNSIGELLIDYRDINLISQAEFANKIGVDARTIQRWEGGTTLIKSEKEEEIVNETFLPFQLIRNLNSPIPIPTYYDFSIRKYSLTPFSKDLPDASWFKEEFKIEHSNVRPIDFDFDKKYLIKFLEFQKNVPKNILNAIQKSIRILPELNLIVTDDSSYYSGHSIVFPISIETYNKLKNKELTENQLNASDIIDYKTEEIAIFYNYNITADNNFNFYFMVNNNLMFFNKLANKNYMYCAIATRHDSFKLNEQLGLKIIWKEEPTRDKMNFEVFPRFYSGTFKSFLKEFSS